MSKSKQIYSYTASKLEYLKSIAGTGAGKKMMANLRHGVGKKTGELPELWGIVFHQIPDELVGTNEASYAENAIYTALTLYALHQQGKDIKENNMNQKYPDDNQEKSNETKKYMSLGRAAAKLIKHEDDTERILNRLHLVVTAVSPEDLAYHLRGIIQLLRQESISLDYAKLAVDLYQFYYEDAAETVKLRWGRDFWNERYHQANKN
ncbi:MAG: type I-E CRISPR-associated protein Cse2/CasB [Ruminococcus sp.]|nr:type I-E CRISPR-associated protein Cse2/CasB [Ruminococcus sp.]